MTTLGWVCAWVGTVLGFLLLGTIWLDVWLASSGRETISRWVLDHAFSPWVPLGLGMFWGLVGGIFIGHFYFPQHTP